MQYVVPFIKREERYLMANTALAQASEEDAHDARVAERAYADYKASGRKSRPFTELLKETGLQ